MAFSVVYELKSTNLTIGVNSLRTSKSIGFGIVGAYIEDILVSGCDFSTLNFLTGRGSKNLSSSELSFLTFDSGEIRNSLPLLSSGLGFSGVT